MHLRALTEEEFAQIIERLNRIEEIAAKPEKRPEDTWLDNQKLLHLLKISKRTAQNYRDKGFIPYSRIGSKFYYRLSDIHEILESNLHISNRSRKQ